MGLVVGYSEDELERERLPDAIRWLDRPKQVAKREGGKVRIATCDVNEPCDDMGGRFVRENVARWRALGRLERLIVHEQEVHLVPAESWVNCSGSTSIISFSTPTSVRAQRRRRPHHAQPAPLETAWLSRADAITPAPARGPPPEAWRIRVSIASSSACSRIAPCSR